MAFDHEMNLRMVGIDQAGLSQTYPNRFELRIGKALEFFAFAESGCEIQGSTVSYNGSTGISDSQRRIAFEIK